MHFIYRTTCLANGKTYIGQKLQCKGCNKYLGNGKALKAAVKKYGKENFKREIICYASTQLLTNFLERYYIKLERQKGKAEYNISDGGCGNNGVRHFSEEHKAKISNAMKNIRHSKEWNANAAKARVGIHFKRGKFSEEHLEHLKEARKRRALPSNETKEKTRETCKKRMSEVSRAFREDNKNLSWNEFQKYYKNNNRAQTL